MIPFDCINNACLHLLKHKNIQIYVQQISAEVENWGSWIHRGASKMLTAIPHTIYNVRLKMDHNCYVDCIFDDEDFNPKTKNPIDKAAKIDSWTDIEEEDKKQCARFIYMLYEMYKLCTNKRIGRLNDDVDDYIFSKTQRIERML